MNKINKILVLAPHTDDGELGCGASMHKFSEQGCEVYYAAFSSCRESVPEHLPNDILEHEVKKACEILLLHPDRIRVFDYQVRKFDKMRQEILDDILLLRRLIQPELVFIPSMEDLHQDHQVIATEGLRAFKNTSVLSYELPWNNISFRSQCLNSISAENLQAKVNALGQYASQQHRSYFTQEFIRGLAASRGVQANSQYAEAFEVVRWML